MIRRQFDSFTGGSPTFCKGSAFLALFFLLLPFSYAMQVLTGRPLSAIFPYACLVITLAYFGKACLLPETGKRPVVLSICFAILIGHNIFSFIASLDDFHLGIRVLVLFTLPLYLFWISKVLTPSVMIRIVKILAVTAMIVAIELLYENISTQVFDRSTEFQLLSGSYVALLTGKDLTQLYLPQYRATGLLEHGHATAFFVACGAFIAASVFIYGGKRRYLGISLLCALSVLLQGFRLPVLAQICAAAGLGTLLARPGDIDEKRRIKIFLLSFAALFLLIAVWDPTGVVRKFYFPAMDGDFQVPDAMTADQWVKYTAADLILNSPWWRALHGESGLWMSALFGHGLVGTLSGQFPFSDDLFLLALPLQYGIVGTVAYCTIWVLSIGTALGKLAQAERSEQTARPRMLMTAAATTLLILAASMLHSGVMQRKAILPLLPLFAGITMYIPVARRR